MNGLACWRGLVLAAAALISLALAGPALAGSPMGSGGGMGGGGMMNAAPEVTAQVAPSRASFARGGSYPLAVVIKVAPGFHINGPNPGSGLIPTKLSLDPPEGVAFSPITLPPAHQAKLAFSPQPVEVYDGQVVARLQMAVSPDAPLGTLAMVGRLSFQACNNQICLMPQTLDLRLSFQVVEKGQEGPPLHPELFPR